MSKIVKIYCEGKRGSHDYDILEKIIENLNNSQIIIEPLGSVRGAGAIIQYKESLTVKSDFKLFFRDRDFDKEIPSSPILESDTEKKYLFYSYRNTIENYLFNENSLLPFINENNLNNNYGIRSIEDTKNKLIEAANNIKYYQAVRHTMGKMRTEKTNFGTKWTEKSGILPDRLDENYCKEKALEMIKIAKAHTDLWSEEEFEIIFESFMERFNKEFMDNMDFLVYFQGKDLATSFSKLLPNFPMKKYYQYAKRHFDYTIFPDLIQLRGIIVENL